MSSSSSSSSSSIRLRAVIAPGNGCTDIENSNWYAYMAKKLKNSGIFDEVVLQDVPDPYEAKERIWVPFLVEECKADENTILIGHSSGAEAAMRLLETHKLLGVVLVCACHTDLGCDSEAISGYYSRPWEWNDIKNNVGKFGILQYHSHDDPFIPMTEADYVAEQLSSEMHRYNNRSHFFTNRSVDDVYERIVQKCKELKDL